MWQALLIPPNVPVILVVDSLNALINSASARFQEMSDRQMMLAVMRSFKTWRQQRGRAITVIFLVEDDSRVLNTAASYIADAIISLRQESIEQGIRETPRIARKWSQELRFCRVEKGRGLPIQSRSCCYEFVSRDEDPEDGDRGIKFLPTYGVPGIVSLFYENRPMREVIKTLRENDVPSLYPQVLVQQFSRSSLQRVFSLRRRTSGISRRHPLMLSNVDEHWLNELKKANLLQPIAISKLSMFSLPLEESAEAKDHTCFIRELTDCKQRVFGGDEQGERCCFGVPQIANVGIFVYRADVLKELGEQPPDTWEGVERICRRLGAMQKPNKLLLELQSYDTFLATALEIGWGHGAFWRTRQMDEGLRIEFDHASSPANLIAALTRLKYWIHGIEIVPLQSSVDPDLYDRDDWVFARHWYSTWVDVRTRSKQTGKQYGVIEIPLAEKHKTHCGPGAKHHSAWGVWYLAIQRGSENVELGIDLINNLMTARKITERARSGAALPTVEKFFELTDETCPHTNLTFRQIRERFFKDAKSRTEFENYPTFSRIFSGVLWTIASNPSINVIEATREAFLNIDPHYSWPDTRNLYGQLKALLSPEMLRWLEGGPVNQAAGE